MTSGSSVLWAPPFLLRLRWPVPLLARQPGLTVLHQLRIQRPSLLRFGRKSEKIQREIEQLELPLEELEAGHAEKREQTEKTLAPAAAAVFAAATRKPARRPLPDHLPLEVAVHEPEQKDCPACGGHLSE